MAEVVGSFFGRLEFQVAGFGEINRKTVEGTAACWIASWLSCWYVSAWTAFPAAAFSISVHWLNALSATVATIAEVISFRGTDNAFILFSVAWALVHFYE